MARFFSGLIVNQGKVGEGIIFEFYNRTIHGERKYGHGGSSHWTCDGQQVGLGNDATRR